MEETARNDNKRKASVISEGDNANLLIDNFKLGPSFLQDDLLEIPQLGPESILTLDSASDAFPDLDIFNADAGNDGGLDGLFASDDELADFLPGGNGTGAFNKVSPSTSESGNINEGLHIATNGLATATAGIKSDSHGSEQHTIDATSGGTGAAASNPSNLQEDEAKKLARMQRNRENAYLSRQRKKQQMSELQQTCTQLRGQATQLTCLVHRLVAENCLLRQHLGAACQKAGMAVPEVPSAMRAAAATPAAAAAGTAAPRRVAVPIMQQSMMPMIPGMVPMGGVQQQQQPAVFNAVASAVPQQPAAAGAAPAALPTAATTTTAPPAVTASGRPVRAKRARITGAGAAFLTLFSIFLFVGPMAPLTGRNNSSFSTSSSSSPAAFSGTPTAGYLPPAAGSDLSNQQLLGPITRSHAAGRSLLQSASIEDSSTTITDPGTHLLSPLLVHQTADALLQDPRSQQLKVDALQRLQDLAPAAVVLDPNDNLDDAATRTVRSNTNTNSNNPLAASTAFPLLADNFFKAAGLDAPQTCQKVFEFDASTLPHPARSRRSVERFITGAYGFKGRSVGLPHIAAAGATATATGRLPSSAESAAFSQSSSSSSSARNSRTLRLPSASTDSGEASLVVKALENERRLHELPFASEIGKLGTYNEDNNNNNKLGDDDSKESTDLLPIAVNEPTLVSVLLPSNASQPGEGGLTAVDRVFVVLLHPGERFITYSCGLSKPLLV